jgi:hypothetical protein
MKILDRLPIAEEHFFTDVRGELLRLRPYQMIVRVSVSTSREWDLRAPNFPALIDTGNNQNFSIQELHLRRWAGIHRGALFPLGSMREGARIAPRYHAFLRIHRNHAGRRDLKEAEPFLLRLEKGIAVFPPDGTNYPRIPLLGLRALLNNNLKLTLEGKRRHVSLRSPIW